MKNRFRMPALVAGIVAVVALGLGFVTPSWMTTNAEAKPSAQSEATPTPTPSPTDSATDTCPAEFQQVASNNVGNRVIGDFEQRYATATLEANNLSDAQRELLITEAGKDATVLAAWSYALGLVTVTEANNTDVLVEDGCLSREGERLFYQFEGALNASGTNLAEGQAPVDGTNSGISDGVFGVNPTSGVIGDRRAIIITLKDGTVVYILVRCGNPVFPGNPGLPEVPTDNPKDIGDAPQRQGNLPEQQMPNQLPANPEYYQPDQPSTPPNVYVPPTAPPPAPPSGPDAPTPAEPPTGPPPVVVETDEPPTTTDTNPGW